MVSFLFRTLRMLAVWLLLGCCVAANWLLNAASKHGLLFLLDRRSVYMSQASNSFGKETIGCKGLNDK